MAYWVSDALLKIFNNPLFYDYSISDGQNKTGNNAKFVRCFWEVNSNKIGTNKKWLFYAKGGGYRKWIGNLIDVVDWSEETREFYRRDSICRIIPEYLWYKKGITWGLITSNLPSFRVLPEEATFDVGGSSIFLKEYNRYNYFIGLFNSKVFLEVVKIFNPTLNFQVKDIRSMPIIIKHEEVVNKIVENVLRLSSDDWNSFEISWNFKRHPFLSVIPKNTEMFDDINNIDLAECYMCWENECNDRFYKLKSNEEEINRIFIDIYGLQEELTPEVDDKDITVRKADLGRDVRSFISYVIGCMFGRYSLSKEGLIFAGGNIENVYAYYHGTFKDTAKVKVKMNGEYTFKELGTPFFYLPVEGKNPLDCWKVDADNIIPITDEEYFSDDIVGRFIEFIRVVYGEKSLETNLDFIANALGNKGNTSREVIRNYFLKDFYADHLKVYQKRPIYWLFDSGKENGFKALIYMHRYDADTVGRVRTDYLHRAQKYVETAMQSAQYTIDNATSASEKSKATKAVTKYTKQFAEMKIYDEAIAHIANKRIEIDLDDGVKVNYEKFQGVEVAQEGKKSLKVDLLAKLK